MNEISFVKYAQKCDQQNWTWDREWRGNEKLYKNNRQQGKYCQGGKQQQEKQQYEQQEGYGMCSRSMRFSSPLR